MELNTKRISWVDTFKAFMMFYIAFGHTVYDYEVAGAICNKYVNSFHVAGFFFIAGYLFNTKQRGFGSFLKSKFKTLMVPYYIFALISLVIYLLLGTVIYSNLDVEVKSLGIIENLFGVFYANGATGYMKWNLPLWFIPCYFITFIIFFYILKTITAIKRILKEHIAVACVMGTLLFIAFVNYYVLQIKYLPLGLEASFYMMPIMLLGYWVRPVIDFGKISKPIQLLGGIALIFAGGVIALTANPNISTVIVVRSQYGNLATFYISALLSIFGYMFLSNLITLKAITYFGRNTMSVLLMHKFPIMIFQLILEKYMKVSAVFNITASILITTTACTLSLLCGEILTKIAPFSVGKKRETNNKGKVS